MRICLVLASWGEGGLERHAIELANALSLTHQVSVIVHPVMIDRFAKAIQVFPVNMDRNRQNPFLLYDIWSILKNNPFDIVHAQASKATILLARIRPFLPKTIGFVASMHNQKSALWAFARMDHLILGGNDGLLGGRTLSIPVSCIYNGIVPSGTQGWTRDRLVQEFGFNSESLVYCAVGRFVPAKGFDILIPAIAASGVQCLLIGDGPERAELEALVQKTGAKVVFSGYRKDGMSLLSVSDGMLISSRNEGFAYVFVEGMLAHRPIIATDIPMVQDFLPREVIVPVDDVAALTEKLNFIQNEPQEWDRLMQPVWAKADAELTLENMVLRVENVYNAIVKSRFEQGQH
ncbi:glycosyltransferase [Aquirhabdus parva]|uniref:Glycosyltransferase n=1 Tax=Aquirhabdus parva TaxID=2283318 RepID=A0A345P741_9GAMM|nr:glycosyltransferase [Aquirhabdus parva]AXI03100.1 glycosyltransferase [Aquirhabdus parva]